MPNAKDIQVEQYQRILVVGSGGAGKTTQIRTLPGRKFAYLFDPAALLSLQGADIDYEQYLPEVLELDASLKGFNKNATDDKLSGTKREPKLYMKWVEDLNKRAAEGYFQQFDWLCFDSLTFLANAVMDRQLFINGRYGAIEDLGDFRVVGSKLADVFRSILSMPINIYCTGHVDSFQDDKTKRIEYQLRLPGKARSILPLMFSNIWLAQGTNEGAQQFNIRTRPEPRGFQHIRTTVKNLKEVEDVSIKDFNRAQQYGIGAILTRAGAVHVNKEKEIA